MQYECFQGDLANAAMNGVSPSQNGAIRIIVLNRYLGSEEVFSRGGSVRLASIVRLAIAEASKPSSRTIMIGRRLVCRAWRVLSSLFLFAHSFSQPETSLLKTPCVVALWPNFISHAYGTTRKVRATHPFGQIDQ
jgi:hypothetical protein